MCKYVIVGNSTAGLAAVRAIREVDTEGKITIVSAEGKLPYSKVLLTHYIAGHLEKRELYLVEESYFSNNNINVIARTKASGVNAGEKRVYLDDGQVIPYDKLLLATGGAPVIPSSLPAGVPGILGLRTIEDACYIRRQVASGVRVAINGGGLVGVKLACALQEAGYFPEIIVGSPYILSQAADDEAAYLVQKKMLSQGVKLRAGTGIAKVIHDDAGVQGVLLSNGEKISCGALVICKSVYPNAGILTGVSASRKGISVDSSMRTAFPDVYAAGDVAITHEITCCESQTVAIWPHAVSQGRVAGQNMAGENTVFEGALSRNAMEIFGLPFISMGIVRPPTQENWSLKINRQKESYSKLVYRDDLLTGAILVGEVATAGELQAVIRKNAAKATVAS